MPWRFKSQKPFNPEPIYAAAKRKWPKWQWYILAFVIGAPLLYLVLRWLFSLVFIIAPAIITTDSISLNAPTNGYVNNLSLSIGQAVKEGQIILTLSTPGLEAKKLYLEKSIVALQKLKQMDLNQKGRELLKHAKARLYNKQQHYAIGEFWFLKVCLLVSFCS